MDEPVIRTQPPSKLSVPRQPSGPTAGQVDPAYVDRLLGAAEAMRAELDNLREQADARRYHLEQVDRELKLAARLQQDFLPRELPEVGCLRIHAVHQGVGHVSGDMYGVERLDEHHLGIHLIDAVGHGMPAALLAMFLRHAIEPKTITDAGYTLLPAGDVLQRLNASLCTQSLTSGFFATALYAKADCRTGTIEIARAGHPQAVHLTKDEATYLGGDGALLGIIPDEAFKPAAVTLAEGDRLVFITDGAECLFADTRYGDPEAWLHAMRARRHLPAAALAKEIEAEVAKVKPDDDVTVVVIERV
jgi:serine phosphatase RsbU (regulator of sigma subunit)